MTAQLIAIFGSIFALIGVALGAFGAHALKTSLSEPMQYTFEVGVRYQMYHALGLLAAAGLFFHVPNPWIAYGSMALIFGTLLFSGSLYILALSGIKKWGMITPIGGLLLLLGWALILLGLL